MSGDKKRYRWYHSSVLTQENLLVDSRSTTTIETSEDKHAESIRRVALPPYETISEKIDRILRKINAWSDETTTKPKSNDNNNTLQQTATFNKATSNYYSIHERQHESNWIRPISTYSFNSLRQRCLSSTYLNSSMTKIQQIPTNRPYSMAFIDESSSMAASNDEDMLYEKPNRVRGLFHGQSSLSFNRYPHQRQSIWMPSANLTPLSLMYGSDFFYPFISEQEQPDYDNLIFTQNSYHHYRPFPTIVLDCQRCNRHATRPSLRDMSCQVPSDEDLNQDDQLQNSKISRSSPLFVSPQSSPPRCQPPMASSLLAPYHFRRKRSLSSYNGIYNRSKSVPSSSSTTSSISGRKVHLTPTLSPSLTPSEPNRMSSTTALLCSIKTSIDSMKKRLKTIRRLSKVGISLDFFFFTTARTIKMIRADWQSRRKGTSVSKSHTYINTSSSLSFALSYPILKGKGNVSLSVRTLS